MISTPTKATRSKGFILFLVLLGLVLVILFRQSFLPTMVLFSNDGPLGAMKTEANKMPGPVLGNWQDLNWLGSASPNATPNLSTLLLILTSPEGYLKLHVPFSLLLLGLSAWLFFRQLNFSPVVCILGGLAAALNSNAFSNGCWGQISRPLSMATTFLAMAAVLSSFRGKSWAKLILAGLAVGLGISEAFDVGALYSLYVAAFVLFLPFAAGENVKSQLGKSVGRLALIVIFSGLIATQTIVSLLGTQLKGTIGEAQPKESPEAKWNFSTAWSTPKMETLGIIVPGLFGYATTTPGEKMYWGKVGQSPGVPTSRFNGSGEYAGILVALLALGAMLNSFRKQKNPFTSVERKLVWFWSALGFLSLLLAFGRHAPFYQIIYPLPFFNTMRNPMKFMHAFHLALLVLFGYGLQALFRQYVDVTTTKAASLKLQWGKWWTTATSFEKKWTFGSIFFVAASLLAWLLYSSSQKGLVAHLKTIGFGGDPTQAGLMAGFSIAAVGWFVLFLLLSVAVVLIIMSGWLSGTRAKWAAILLGTILIVDLARADAPWIVYWNYKDKYASNPIIEVLKEKPYEHRVTLLPIQHPDLELLGSLYRIEWTQHLFLYYNIQAFEVIQNPRPGSDEVTYRNTFPADFKGLFRQWELSNTRFILAPGGGFVDALNQQFDPTQKRFKIHTGFDIAPRPGVTQATQLTDLTTAVNPNGKLALIEFTGALPRAKLYSNWQISSNDQSTLDELKKSEFDPQKTVLISNETPVTAPSSTNQNAGTVEFVSYAPKKIELNAKAESPSVLLLNDRYHPDWKVSVDGQPAKLLRCDYIMRGVHLPAGTHKIVFEFRPSISSLYVSLSAIVIGLILCGYLFAPMKRTSEKVEPKNT